jgi:catechol 2,3-dioxygenase-like lactoylglutathione lyase family enzyme
MQRVRPHVVASKRGFHRRIGRTAEAGLIALALTFAFFPALAAAKTTTSSGPNAPYTWGHAVANLDKTVSFYHDVLGLQLVRSVPRRAAPDRQYASLTDTPGAKYRSAFFKVPNEPFLLEFTQYTGIPKKKMQPTEADPGAAALTLTVKNPAAAYAALRKAHTPTLLPGGTIPTPTSPPGLVTVFVRDPDGYIVEVVHRLPGDWFTVSPPSITNGPGMRYVIRGQLDLSVASLPPTLNFYQHLLGFDINPGFPPLVGSGLSALPPPLASMFGITPGSQWGADTGNCTPTTRCEYYNYLDPARTTFNPAIQDPGAPIETIKTHNIKALVSSMKASGIRIVTRHHAPVTVDERPSIIVRDPSGVLIRLQQDAHGGAPPSN